MSDIPEGKIIFQFTPTAIERESYGEYADVAEEYRIVEHKNAICGLIVFAKYRGKWQANTPSNRALIRKLLEWKPAVEKFLNASGHDLCHENRKELAAAFGIELPSVEAWPNLPPEYEFKERCERYRQEIYKTTFASIQKGTFMYPKYTDRFRKVMQLANQEAQRFNHPHIEAEHILLGLLKEGGGVAASVLKNLDIDLRKIRLEVEKSMPPGPEMITMGKLPQTQRTENVIKYAIEEARNLNHNYVGTEHLLLGILREQECSGVTLLAAFNLTAEIVCEKIVNLLVESGARHDDKIERNAWHDAADRACELIECLPPEAMNNAATAAQVWIAFRQLAKAWRDQSAANKTA